VELRNDWHNLTADEVLHRLGSRRHGLSDAEVKERLRQHGANELRRRKKTSPAVLFFRQFLSPLIYILLTAAIISLVTHHYIDAYVIFGILLANATIGFIQEGRAERAMEALLQMAAPRAKVRRDGVVKQVPAREIVPGDIVLLDIGDRVPADARLIECSNLKVDEAILTGESMPVDKHTQPLHSKVALADRKNIVHMNTVVTYGRATAVVVATGMSTAIGTIAGTLEEIEPEKTPLQQSISRLGRFIIILVLSALIILFVEGIIRGIDWTEMFFLAVAAGVSAIPEGLPAVVTVVLALGMQAMARRNAIVRRLVAVETLGSATVVCSDKTGTLTLNQMTVQRIYCGGRWVEVSGEGYVPKGEFRQDGRAISPGDFPALVMHLKIGALCNDALLSREGEEECCSIIGDPTEGALLVVAAKAGLDKEELETRQPRLDEIPFQSEKQYMVTVHPDGGGKIAFVKGAPEKLLSMSAVILTEQGNEVPLDQEHVDAIRQAQETMAQQALRVIGTAYARLPVEAVELTESTVAGRLVFVGLSGMADPPRHEAKEAVRLCHRAGIQVKMITGDHKLTAEAIARQLGLGEGRTVTGAELQAMDDDTLAREIENISVFARIEPIQKLRIVRALKSRGHVVAMTGDGVNDAPALKAADIGVAMGITGTDVSKEASDIVLADDNFASVVAAVEEGRSIFNRLRNVVFYLLSSNFGELLGLILCVLLIGKAPLLALQIIWINLVTDGAAAIPLGMEGKVGDELKQPPRHPRVGLLFPGLLLRVTFLATLMSLGIFFVFSWAQVRMDLGAARTVTFCAVAVMEWFKAFLARSDEHTAFELGIRRNRWLPVTIGAAVLLQMAVVYLPFMQVAFGTVPIGAREWGVAIAAGASLFAVEELRKVFLPRLFSLGKWQPVSRKSG